MEKVENVQKIEPEHFDDSRHYYPKSLNTTLHPLVRKFFALGNSRIIERYCHINPKVSAEQLMELLQTKCRFFYWGGSDIFYVTSDEGVRKMVTIETNSCPSGQKSMPLSDPFDEYRGYRVLLEHSFLPRLKIRRNKVENGVFAVIYDKNFMEASGYACTLADLTKEPVYLVPCFDDRPNAYYFKEGVLWLKLDEREVPVKAALRYVTQTPWDRIPIKTRTLIYNPIIICLAGGRNKLIASKAYEIFNSQINQAGLEISTPETIRDVNRSEIPMWLDKFAGKAVVKIPYSNAGQGVYTITNEQEAKAFMDLDIPNHQFIVQSLIGHYAWSSHTNKGLYYHIGTLPDKRNKIYVYDIRMMVSNGLGGFAPVAVYARRARKPLLKSIHQDESWDILGTNLSEKLSENTWTSDTARLMLLDEMDFNKLGIGIDDLIEAYIQTSLSILAIDQMAGRLINKEGQLKRNLFKSLNNDPQLLEEISQSALVQV